MREYIKNKIVDNYFIAILIQSLLGTFFTFLPYFILLLGFETRMVLCIDLNCHIYSIIPVFVIDLIMILLYIIRNVTIVKINNDQSKNTTEINFWYIIFIGMLFMPSVPMIFSILIINFENIYLLLTSIIIINQILLALIVVYISYNSLYVKFHKISEQ